MANSCSCRFKTTGPRKFLHSVMFTVHGCIHLLMSVVIAILLKELILLYDGHGIGFITTLNRRMTAPTERGQEMVQTKVAGTANPSPTGSTEGSVPMSSTIFALFSSSVPSGDDHSAAGGSMGPTEPADTMSSSVTMGASAVNEPESANRGFKVAEGIAAEGSSVWCFGSDHTNRLCRFKNLCYFPEEDHFVFLHSSQTVMDGVPRNRYNPALLDLSSARDHNAQYFNFIDMPADQLTRFPVDVINGPSLVFNRFNPDNIMHVIHDDLLPMMHTLQLMQGGNRSTSGTTFEILLVFMEGWQSGDYYHLYQLFSTHNPLLKDDLLDKPEVTCFRDAFVGISKATTWYQYGFKEPQGPVPRYSITANEIKQFAHFLKGRLNIKNVPIPAGERYIILFSRKHNRLILNEVDVVFGLVREFGLKVVSVGVETHSLAEMIAILGQTAVLIGMHGSLLSLAMFLPPGAVVVELFPYAVNPNNYTPYRTLTEIPGMNLVYRAWRNMHVKNTVTYPDRPWETGGIRHLSPEDQQAIINSHEVPRHLCCRNPEWLFRIYQDTIVDVPSFLETVHLALKDRSEYMSRGPPNTNDLMHHRIFPSFTQNIDCIGNSAGTDDQGDIYLKPPSIVVSWEPPWNLKYLDKTTIAKYEVWIQEVGEETYSAWILSKTSHRFNSGLKPDTQYHIWVRCILNNATFGPFNQKPIHCRT